MIVTDPMLGGLGLVAAALVWWLDRRARRPRRVLIASHRLLPPPDPERARRAQRAMTLELILLLSAALALGLAASGPVWTRAPESGPVETLILVRDLSTRAGGGARLARLKAVAEGLARSRPAGTRFRLRAVPGSAAPAADPLALEELLERLSSLSARPAIGDPAAAVEAALVGDPSRAIWLVADRDPELPAAAARFVGLRAIAAAMENLGIVGCGVEAAGPGPDSPERVTVSVMNGGATSRRVRVRSGELMTPAMNVRPGEVVTRTLVIPAGLAELVLSLCDDRGEPWRDSLAEDDRVHLVREPTAARVCALYGVWPAPAVAVLEAFPGLVVESRGAAPRPGGAEPALSIFPGGVPAGLPTPAVVVVAPGEAEAVAGTARLEPHPELPGVTADRFRVEAASPELPAGLGALSPVVTDERGRVLVGLGGRGAARVLVLGFRLEDAGGWVERESFARLLASFVDQVLPATGGQLVVHRLGEPAALPGEPSAGARPVRGPDGASWIERGSSLRAPAPGVYELGAESDPARRRLSFGVLDPAVTRLGAVELRREARATVRAPRTPRRVGLRGPIGLLALALVLPVVARRSRRAGTGD